MGDLIMKKTISILLLCAMLLCACGETENTPGPLSIAKRIQGAPIPRRLRQNARPDCPAGAALWRLSMKSRTLSGDVQRLLLSFARIDRGNVLNDASQGDCRLDTEERLAESS